ncbi:hypothetical protein PMIN01_04120 [Paraphaeosphaeria minitans]|uniref:F-box domain-containing protein n=1 Tax=Paraphaeosphaeria minitans TaxID=565426 RepID=A0A9P6GND0_9PLEO|nr:hypothetical protein PMIN01_04120 [Paraphaeosphaeria minitans]
MAYLLNLPVELLQRIASFLNCCSALALARVSRTLHDACNHRVVFRDIALYSFAHDFNDPRAELLLWPEGCDILKGASLPDTIRLACAVERAVKHAVGRAGGRCEPVWIAKERTVDSRNVIFPDIDEWLPQLLAWHHPSCKYMLDTSLLPAHLQLGKRLDSSSRASFINVGFCLAYFALQNVSSMSGDVYTPFEIEDSIAKMSTEYMFSVCWGLKPPHVSQGFSSFDLAQGSTCIIPFLYSILGSGLFGRIPFPVPSRIPFRSFMDVPWVFTDSAEAFSICHIPKMTEFDFLTGTWMGYYTDQRLVNHRHFALVGPPMNDINIVAKLSDEPNKHSEPKGHIGCSESSGFDSYGRFTICGEFYHDGRVELVKHYTQHSWEWQYNGIVIPFGIVGRWSDLEGNFGGHFWIWKKDWCDSQAL